MALRTWVFPSSFNRSILSFLLFSSILLPCPSSASLPLPSLLFFHNPSSRQCPECRARPLAFSLCFALYVIQSLCPLFLFSSLQVLSCPVICCPPLSYAPLSLPRCRTLSSFPSTRLCLLVCQFLKNRTPQRIAVIACQSLLLTLRVVLHCVDEEIGGQEKCSKIENRFQASRLQSCADKLLNIP